MRNKQLKVALGVFATVTLAIAAVAFLVVKNNTGDTSAITNSFNLHDQQQKDINDYIKITNLGDFEPNETDPIHQDIIDKINVLNGTSFTRSDIGVEWAGEQGPADGSAYVYGWGYVNPGVDGYAYTGSLLVTWNKLPDAQYDVNNAIINKDLGDAVMNFAGKQHNKNADWMGRSVVEAINSVNTTEFDVKDVDWQGNATYAWGRDLKITDYHTFPIGSTELSYATVVGQGKYYGSCVVTWTSFDSMGGLG